MHSQDGTMASPNFEFGGEKKGGRNKAIRASADKSMQIDKSKIQPKGTRF